MVKATLLEVYTSGTPHHGLYLVWDRVHKVLIGKYLLPFNRVTFTRIIIYYINMWKGLPKESAIEVSVGTGGSPKEENFHGDRVLILPQNRISMMSGRSTGHRVFNLNLGGLGEARRHLSTKINNLIVEKNELTILNKLKNLQI
jgi:hypothetical protein